MDPNLISISTCNNSSEDIFFNSPISPIKHPQSTPSVKKNSHNFLTIDGTHLKKAPDVLKEKDPCLLAVGDPEKKDILLMDIVKSENVDWAINALSYCRNQLGILPLLVICDFSAALIAAIIYVYGETHLGIDGFHVMQALNRAIHKDLIQFRKQQFIYEQHNLKKIREWLHQLHLDLKKTGVINLKCVSSPPEISRHQQISLQLMKIIESVLKILLEQTIPGFKTALCSFISATPSDSVDSITTFFATMIPLTTKHIRNEKSFQKQKEYVLQKLKAMCLDARKPLEDASVQFYREMWLIFLQPKRVTPKIQRILDSFLKRYPTLRSYRELTLRVGSIYRKSYSELGSQIIEGITVLPEWGEDLKTCITTFKKYQTAILRFRKMREDNPEISKGAGANLEYKNRNIKKVFRAGFNRLALSQMKKRLVYQVGGVIRDFITPVISPQTLNTAVKV